MRHVKFIYKVEIECIFTEEEIAHLIELSQAHYDGYCRSVSEQGGFLYGMRNFFDHQVDDQATVPYRLTWDQADTLCKILESPGASPKLVTELKETITDITEETVRLNT